MNTMQNCDLTNKDSSDNRVIICGVWILFSSLTFLNCKVCFLHFFLLWNDYNNKVDQFFDHDEYEPREYWIVSPFPTRKKKKRRKIKIFVFENKKHILMQKYWNRAILREKKKKRKERKGKSCLSIFLPQKLIKISKNWNKIIYKRDRGEKKYKILYPSSKKRTNQNNLSWAELIQKTSS